MECDLILPTSGFIPPFDAAWTRAIFGLAWQYRLGFLIFYTDTGEIPLNTGMLLSWDSIWKDFFVNGGVMDRCGPQVYSTPPGVDAGRRMHGLEYSGNDILYWYHSPYRYCLHCHLFVSNNWSFLGWPDPAAWLNAEYRYYWFRHGYASSTTPRDLGGTRSLYWIWIVSLLENFFFHVRWHLGSGGRP